MPLVCGNPRGCPNAISRLDGQQIAWHANLNSLKSLEVLKNLSSFSPLSATRTNKPDPLPFHSYTLICTHLSQPHIHIHSYICYETKTERCLGATLCQNHLDYPVDAPYVHVSKKKCIELNIFITANIIKLALDLGQFGRRPSPTTATVGVPWVSHGYILT